jgi:predicted transcriptional regulator of viral defense system
MTGSISKKEVEFISELEFNKKYFFTRKDIIKYFTSEQEMGVYLHRMRKKGRIEKISRSKYYLIPIRALKGKWTEHAFIVADEIFDGKNYVIGGKSAAHYWHLIDQIPFTVEIFTFNRQGTRNILGIEFKFIRISKTKKMKTTIRKIGNHPFIIATKEESKQWI